MIANGSGGALKTMTLFLAGDVMTGRGIDQILAHPGSPEIHERFASTALDYLKLAESAHGPIRRPADYNYVWGDALAELDRRQPDLRAINLETALTSCNAREPKGINYRMHPDNIGILTAARIQACSLANNHVLDWGSDGLRETLATLRKAGIGFAGAGQSAFQATAPFMLAMPDSGRVLFLACACGSSGIPQGWAARAEAPGINLLPDLSRATVATIGKAVRAWKERGDIAVASIHWGGNWGYEISDQQREFAHGLITDARIDIVHGHSSHHAKAIEVHRGKLVLYGCGDFINDYEGIGGFEHFRSDLSLMYLPRVDANDGALISLDIVPFAMRRFRLQSASRQDTVWLAATLSREGMRVGTRIELGSDNVLHLQWN